MPVCVLLNCLINVCVCVLHMLVRPQLLDVCVCVYDFTVHAGLYKHVGVNKVKVNAEVCGYYEKVLSACGA